MIQFLILALISLTPSWAQEPPEATPSLKRWSFGIGPYGSVNLNSEEVLYGFSASRHWSSAEYAEIEARLAGALTFEDSSNFFSGTLGGSYLHHQKNFTPLVGAGFGLGLAHGPSLKAKFGFSGRAFLGARLFQGSEVQMQILLEYQTLFAKNSEGVPGIFGGQLSILF